MNRYLIWDSKPVRGSIRFVLETRDIQFAITFQNLVIAVVALPAFVFAHTRDLLRLLLSRELLDVAGVSQVDVAVSVDKLHAPDHALAHENAMRDAPSVVNRSSRVVDDNVVAITRTTRRPSQNRIVRNLLENTSDETDAQQHLIRIRHPRL